MGHVLARAELSLAPPFLSLARAGVTAAAIIFLKERFSAGQRLPLVPWILGAVTAAVSGA